MLPATAAAARYWDAQSRSTSQPICWWQVDEVTQHINRRICGEALPGFGAGARALLRRATGGRKFKHGVSVGCGVGAKEMWLIQDGLVERFDLYEIAGKRVEAGRRLYARNGLSDRVTFTIGDAFALADRRYDFVHWDSSLHHMLDVPEALEWSRRVLTDDGWILVNEFIGPTRFQWSSFDLACARLTRALLPASLQMDPRRPGRRVRWPKRITIRGLIASDPSEAADSGRIVPTTRKMFPKGEWQMLGGVIYRLALHGILGNFAKTPGGARWLQRCLAADDVLSALGCNHLGIFVAPKS
jgi:SAM-dependent methyltransferase